MDVTQQLSKAIFNANTPEIKLLLCSQFINAVDRWGDTPLHLAAASGQQKVVEWLLDNGALINKSNQHGDTPLHRAAYKGHRAIVELLLDRGAAIHAENEVSETPLCEATWQECSKPVIQLLLQRGAYRYRHRKSQDMLLSDYWKNPVINNPKDKHFYTILLLAGVFPENGILPRPLRAIQDLIEDTVVDWLRPAQLSLGICRQLTTSVLRALPRLIYWMKVVC